MKACKINLSSSPSFVGVHKNKQTNKQTLPKCLFDLGIKHFQIDSMLKVQCVSMAGVGRRVISHPRRKKVQYESMAR